ncbi:MAG: glycosyltransferase family 4 protein [Gemmataceae bacterium]|nr:glycosyltransferase family 4 protein [Gemmataceae bacterium]
MNELHVAVIDEELPWPPISGKRIRTMGLLSRLAERHRITYVCHQNNDPDEGRAAAAHFRSLGIQPVVVERRVPPKSGLGFCARLFANLFSPLPYSVASHSSPEMDAALERLSRTGGVDLWHVEWTPYAHALRNIPGRRLVMAHNVESVIWQRYVETERNPLKRWYMARQWRKFIAFERGAVGRADLTVAVSGLDAERFRDMGAADVQVVDNGVDTACFAPAGVRRRPEVLLFVGSLEWRPNLDGAAQLLEKVFPAVRAEVPEAELWLVGRNPPRWLRDAASRPGVKVHADVPDVRPFLHQAGQLVVPLRIGGGSRLKILEALACGTPVVSTAVGAEGLELDERHLDTVPDVDSLAEAVIASMSDPRRARTKAGEGRRRVLARYDWGPLADKLEGLWHECADARARRLEGAAR